MLLHEPCEQAGYKPTLSPEAQVPRGHLQAPAGPEHKGAALQTCSVPAAEESLL